jgi:hypothetical protein
MICLFRTRMFKTTCVKIAWVNVNKNKPDLQVRVISK